MSQGKSSSLVSSHCVSFFLFKKKRCIYGSLLKETNVCIAGDSFYSSWVRPGVRSAPLSAGELVGAEAGPALPRWCLCVVYIHEQSNDFGTSLDFPSSQKCISGLVLEPFSCAGEEAVGEAIRMVFKAECSGQQVPSCPLQMGIMTVLSKSQHAWGWLGFPE